MRTSARVVSKPLPWGRDPRKSRSVFVFAVTAFCTALGSLSPCVRAQDSLTPVPSAVVTKEASPLLDRLRRVNAVTALDETGVSPWHLKMEVQLFDAKGKPHEQGTIEEWWAAPGSSRIVYDTPSYSATVLRHDGQVLFTKGKSSPPDVLDALLAQAVHPMPFISDLSGINPTLRKQNFGKVQLDCIMLNRPIKGTPFPPLGLFPTYCMDPGEDSLRASFSLGAELILRNAMGKFQGKTVATSTTYRLNDIDAGTGHVSTLETGPNLKIDIVSSDGLEVTSENARVAGGVMAGQILHKVQPIYPAGSRANHISGTVILHAVIARDGTVRKLTPISVPDPYLALAAIAAVRQWTYTPYLLNGAPTDVDTTITVNFTQGIR